MNPLQSVRAALARRQEAKADLVARELQQAEVRRLSGYDDDYVLSELLDVVAAAQTADADAQEDLQRRGLALFSEIDRRGLVMTPPARPSVVAVAPAASLPVPTGKTAREVELAFQIAEAKAQITKPAAEAETTPTRRTDAQIAAQIDAAIAVNVRERFAHQKPGGRS